jgi:malonyl CoA-acyl carrier protein transacylase/NAD(P)-dependent dehydrogenase (short-subunit alcohol dehydrogenase family)
VKSQIGHTKCAAGLAGLIKAALALHHRVLPPTLHVKQPNPYWDPKTSPFVFGDAARPWLENERVAAVSAFGFGGTNFHCVLAKRGAPEEPGLAEWPAELFLVRGRDAAAALEVTERLALLAREARPLRELAAAACLGKGPVLAAFVARDRDQLRGQLAALADGLRGDKTPLPEGIFRADEHTLQGGLAFLFPGQGSQRPGMLRELAVAFPSATRLLARAPHLAARMMPPAAFSPETRARDLAALTDTRVAQPALGIADLLMAELFTRVGVRPVMAGGHSYGELVALTYAGALDEADLVPLSEARASSILSAAGEDPGAMAAVSASAAAVRRALSGTADVVIANENAPDQTVIAGPTAAVEAAVTALAAAGLEAKRLQVACAFHSPVVARAKALFGAELAAVPLRAPLLPVYSNVTAAPHERSPEAIRERLAEHVVSPVLFARQIEAMYAAGARIFVEVGPGRVLTGLVRKILGSKPHHVLASDQSTGSGIGHFLTALAELATLGVPVDPRPLFAARDVPLWELARPPVAGPSPSTWLVTGQLARPPSGELPPGSLRPTLAPVLRAGAANEEAPASSEEGVVLHYLSSMRELARAQRDVMLRFLGTAPQGLVFDATFEEAPEATRGALERSPEARGTSPAQALGQTVPAALAPQELLLSIVAERTGYPVEMLDLDLNLEAELSIDSIKRIEILGVLSVRLGISQTGTDEAKKIVEQLARVKTLRGILDWLDARTKGELPEVTSAPLLSAPALPTLPSPSIRTTLAPGAVEHASSSPHAPTPASHVATKAGEVVRLVPRAAPRELGRQGSVRGKRIAVTDDGEGFAPGMVEWLEAAGARAALISRGGSLAGFDGVLDLAGLGERATEPNSVSRSALAAFELVQRVADARPSRFVAAAWLAEGGAAGEPGRLVPPLGWSGLVRSLVKERPETRASIVGLEPAVSPELLIERLGEELARGDEVEVRWVNGERYAVELMPATPLAESAEPLLARGDVVLVTGGARGVTAAIAVALAARFGASLELVGRTPLPGDEEPALAPHRDARALRRHLATRGDLANPRAIEAAVLSILAAREVRSTFAELTRLGVRARYHALDVRDDEAFGELVERLYAEHGRIDGFIHGAGVVEDRLLEQKTAESFSRVFDTKVRPALVLAERLRAPCRFVAFFGSVVGALGNAGQADYAAANAALETIARGLTGRVSGRVVCLGWGPWSGAGMVNDDLARAYERAGMTLLPLAEGVDAFLREVASPGGPSVVIVHGEREDPLRAFRGASAAAVNVAG